MLGRLDTVLWNNLANKISICAFKRSRMVSRDSDQKQFKAEEETRKKLYALYGMDYMRGI